MTNTLFSPFSTSQQDIKYDLIGGFEEDASVDTVAAVADSVRNRFTKVEYRTLDVLNRKSGDRRPLFDTQTGKMSVIAI